MYYYGIDLGTTNSVITIFNEVDKTNYSLSLGGKKLFKSRLTLVDGEEIVGLNRIENTIRNVKSSIGANSIFKVCDKEYTAIEVSAKILLELKRVAKENGHNLTDVTITVPAKFNHTERQNTLRAAKLAGLTVTSLINEPTSAAICYADLIKNQELVFVYDLGGGTFDISLVQIMPKVKELNLPKLDIYEEGNDNQLITVIDSDGDINLGGNNIDNLIEERFIKDNNIDIELLTERDKKIIRENSTDAKEMYIDRTVTISIGTYIITKELVRECVIEILKQTRKIMTEVLSRNNAKVIDKIILVGGSTKHTLVPEYLRECYPNIQVFNNIDPDECVGLGASKNSYIIKNKNSKIIMTDITNDNFGIEAKDTYGRMVFQKMIDKSTTIPSRTTRSFNISHKGQTDIFVGIYQGSNIHCEFNTKIGDLIINNIPEDSDVKENINCTFEIDLNGILSVIVNIRNKEYTKKIELSSMILSEVQDDDLFRRIEELTEEFF